MTTTEPALEHLSVDEVRAALEALTNADWNRLGKIARTFGPSQRSDPDDLLQTALERTLNGKRRCPREVDFIRFLAEVMRSIASDEAKALKRKPETHLVPRHSDDDDNPLEYDYPDPSTNAETALADDQQAGCILAAVLAIFDDDVVAQTIVEGIAEGMDAKELHQLTGLNEREYASKRRLMRRRIDKAFPEGWRS